MERKTWGEVGARPLFFPSLSAGLGVWFGGRTNGGWVLFLSAAVLWGALSLWRAPRTGAHLALLLAFGLGGAGLARAARFSTSQALPLSAPARIEGEVESVQSGPSGARLELAVTRVSDVAGEHFRARVFARGEGLAVYPGQKVELSSQLRPLRPPANPGEWDGRGELERRGVRAVGSFPAHGLVTRSEPSPLWPWLQRTQERLRAKVLALAPSQAAAGFYLTLAAGLRAELGPDWERKFSRSGLAHLLSVSGLHVAALAWMVLALGRALLVRFWPSARHRNARRWAALLALPWIWAYVFFTGNQPPAVRSALMASAVFAGLALSRRADALNSLAAAALLLLVLDPSCIANLSLQLSALAVLALLLVAPAVRALLPVYEPPPDGRIRRALHGTREAVFQSLATSLAATAASVPLVAEAFHQISLSGLWTNILCLPLGGVLTAFSAGGAVAFALWPPLSVPFIWAGTRLSALLLAIVSLGAAVPWAALPVASVSPLWSLLYVVGLFGWALAEGRARWLGVLVPASLLVAWVIPVVLPPAEVSVTFLAVGHGDAILLSSQGEHALVDGGGEPGGHVGERHVLPALRELGVRRLRLAVLSHPHADHALGLSEVLSELPVERVWLSEGLANEPLARQVARAAGPAAVETVRRGHAPFRLGVATLEVEGPPDAAVDLHGDNDRSVVVRVRHGDVQFLLTGDIEAPAEAVLDAGPATVLKAPHHGSATSSTPDFLARVHPRFVVFCVGEGGRFHFPHPAIEARYLAAGVRCLRTDRDGAIRFLSDGRDVQVQTFLQATPTGRVAGWLPISTNGLSVPER